MTDLKRDCVRDRLIAFTLLPFLTPARIRILLERFAVEELPVQAVDQIARALTITEAEAALVKDPLKLPELARRVEALRPRALVRGDDGYPPLLAAIDDPPVALFVEGDRSLLAGPCVAVVGSRRASPYGVNAATSIAGRLAAAGVVVVSGLAYGIDAAAHRAALEAGGKTIAVLGTGTDVVYPRTHRRLHEQLAAAGALVSEFPPGTLPRPMHFPIRNRVIAGLSLGTIVVEAAARSGSLITARLACEQGREVFAVPGSIFSARSEGTHRLIQTGAKLLHDLDDVFDELPSLPRPATAAEAAEVDPALAAALEVFSFEEPLSLDAAAERLKLSVAAVSAPLLQLELAGLLRAVPGGRYVRMRR